MSDRDSLLVEFANITGADPDRSRFFLELANWNLELAVSAFFEDIEQRDPGEPDVEIVDGADSNSIQILEDHPAPIIEFPADSSGASSMSRRINTLRPESDDSSSDDEAKRGQAFFVGGSERSGQQVLGPPRRDPEEVVKDLFQKARQHGAEEVTASRRAQTEGSSIFAGSGYRLGDTLDAALRTEEDAVPDGGQQSTRRQQVSATIQMWRNGFVVDDGELRAYDDPANRDFLTDISRGMLPRELIAKNRGAEVTVDMEDHRGDDYQPPKRPVKPFSGEGHTLGSPSPVVVGASGGSSSKSAEPSAQQAPPPVNLVDPNRPVTQVQIRLADGSRLVTQFNADQSVGDLRAFIRKTRPDYAERGFSLMTSFPQKSLEDDTKTLSEVGLLNAVVVQKLT